MIRVRKPVVLLATAMLLVIWGCDGGGGGAPAVSGSSEESTVKGTVTIKGKPASKGTVVFDPANTSRRTALARNAEIGSDGTFTVTTLVGQNIVSLEGRGMPTYRQPVDVKSGGDTVNIDVK